MFDLKNVKLVNKLSNANFKLGWFKATNPINSDTSRNKLIEEITKDNKFVQEDAKLRAMVEEMLEKEFSSDIKNIKSYDFLVDSVVNKLKNKQLKSVPVIKSID